MKKTRTEKMILSMCVVCLMSTSFVWAQTEDPFRPQLPTQRMEDRGPVETGVDYSDFIAAMYKISIEGIFWSESFSAAIINGIIYNEGDQIEGVEAKIEKITNGQIVVNYKGKQFILSRDDE